MERHHEGELNIAIETLIDAGFVKIEWAKIYRWYGQERLSKKACQDLYERIEEVANQKNIAISYINNYAPAAQGNGYCVLFVDSRTVSFKDTFNY